MKLKVAKREFEPKKAVEAFGTATPEFPFNGFSRFRHSFEGFPYHFTYQSRENPVNEIRIEGKQRFVHPDRVMT